MTRNTSLQLSETFRERLSSNLLAPLNEIYPHHIVAGYIQTHPELKTRNKVYTLDNTLFTMTFTATQEDKSLQSSVNLFTQKYETESEAIQKQEQELLEAEKQSDSEQSVHYGRPKLYKSKLPKSLKNRLSSSTAGYTNARQRVPLELIKQVFDYSTDFGEYDKELWKGYKIYNTDGTYVQLQDTESIREYYPVTGGENQYPQALLQVFTRAGSGQICQYALGSRKTSELQLVIPMINKLNEKDLLLADDLYNTYFHFFLIQSRQAQIIVPGKRERDYTVIESIETGEIVDEIVEIQKSGKRPDYVAKETWRELPKTQRLRRIVYTYPTKNGQEECVLYTTLTDKKIPAKDIIKKYTSRWDIEISIREMKTLMDINVLRSKSPAMLEKELVVSLTAYNMVRKIIAQSAEKAGFSPQKPILQECATINRSIPGDKTDRIFTGR
jgi:hypothetical protein